MQRKTHGTRWRCGTLQGKGTPANCARQIIMVDYVHLNADEMCV